MRTSKPCCRSATEGGEHAVWLETLIEAAERKKKTKVFYLLLCQGHQLTPGRYIDRHERLFTALRGLEGNAVILGDEMVSWVDQRWWRRRKASRSFQYLTYVRERVLSGCIDVRLVSYPAVR